MQHDSAKLAIVLKRHMERNRLSQVHVAEQADVNQGTVSRFLKKPPQRVTGASMKLCNYVESKLLTGLNASGKEPVQEAFEECWNKSPVHAEAISKIIYAFAEFCRREPSEEEESSG